MKTTVYTTIVGLLAAAFCILVFVKMSDLTDSVSTLGSSLTGEINKVKNTLKTEIDKVNVKVVKLETEAEKVEAEDEAAKAAAMPSKVIPVTVSKVPLGRQEITGTMSVEQMAKALKYNAKHNLTLTAHRAHRRAYRKCMARTIKLIRKEISSRSGLGRWTIAPMVDGTSCNGLVLKPKVASGDQKEAMLEVVSLVWSDLSTRYTLDLPEDATTLDAIVINRLSDEEWDEAKFEAKKEAKLAKLQAKQLKLKMALARKLNELKETKKEVEESNFETHKKAKAKARKLAKARARARTQRRLKKALRLQAARVRALESKIDALEQAETVEELTLEIKD